MTHVISDDSTLQSSLGLTETMTKKIKLYLSYLRKREIAKTIQESLLTRKEKCIIKSKALQAKILTVTH